MVVTDGVGGCKLIDYIPAVDINSFHIDETGQNFPPTNTAPANPPANLDAGDTVIEHWDDAQVYWTWDGTNWIKNWVLTEAPDIVTTLVDNADGSFTYTNETGVTSTISICTLMGYCNLDAIGDVNAPTPTSGQVLTWNGTAWVAATLPGGFTGFNINDTNGATPVQGIASGETITFVGNNLITATVTATDTVTHGINTSGASAGQAIIFNGSNAVWATLPTTSNLFTASDDQTVPNTAIVQAGDTYKLQNNNTLLDITLSKTGTVVTALLEPRYTIKEALVGSLADTTMTINGTTYDGNYNSKLHWVSPNSGVTDPALTLAAGLPNPTTLCYAPPAGYKWVARVSANMNVYKSFTTFQPYPYGIYTYIRINGLVGRTEDRRRVPVQQRETGSQICFNDTFDIQQNATSAFKFYLELYIDNNSIQTTFQTWATTFTVDNLLYKVIYELVRA